MVETHIPSLAEDQDVHIQSCLRYPPSTPHLNAFGLVINNSPTNSGRGVYASREIASETLIEISPVLLFPPEEYHEFGSKTQLDGYTFIWKRTSNRRAIMALALGLGSLFNHSKSPNVKWTLDHSSHSIRYETVRRVEEGEELCISYGTGRMWWEPELTAEEREREETERIRSEDVIQEALQMGRIGFSDEQVESEQVSATEASLSPKEKRQSVSKGVDLELMQKADRSQSQRHFPPMYRLTCAIDPATLPLATRDAWIIDIAPTSASLAVKFLQKQPAVLQNRDDGRHSTRHLRSFRTTSDAKTKLSRTQFLLCLRTAFPDRTTLVQWLSEKAEGIFGEPPEPYLAPVPVIAAPTKQRLAEWQAVWPCIVRTNPKELVPANGGDGVTAPVLLIDRQKDAAMWTQDRVRLRWALNRFKRVVALARHALSLSDEQAKRRAIGSAVHVTHAFDVAKRMVPSEQSMSWIEREEMCDWSQLTGPTAPLVGRIQPLPSARTCSSSDSQDEYNVEKVRLLDSLAMSAQDYAQLHATSRAVYTSNSTSVTGTIEVDALDQRILRRNPLKHGVIEAIARVSVLRTLDRVLPSTDTSTNGSDYLLTSLSLFSLYEPCVYCTMALVHSRVSEVYFLLPSPGRGACSGAHLPDAAKCDAGHNGGIYALQEQKGLNHSFAVWQCMLHHLQLPDLPYQPSTESLHHLAHEFDIGLLDP